MKILYGVNGEGMGHAMRAAVVGNFLESRGHDLQFVSSSGRALKFLESRWPGKVISCVGLGINMAVGNSVSPLATFLGNAAKQYLASPWLHLATAAQVRIPDVVISDFDYWSARYAGLLGKPLIAIDNIHFLSKCAHPKEFILNDRQAAALMYPVVSSAVPKADRYLVTTFASAPILKSNASLHLPIIRQEIQREVSFLGNHVVSYFNDKADHRSLLGAFAALPGVEFRCYGLGGVYEKRQSGNITVLPMSEEGFIGDLASCKACIGGAGFTLVSEAIFLKKPMLAVPFGGHFEQILNANYLEKLGYGERGRGALSAEQVAGFLSRAPAYQENLAGFQHDGNAELLQAVEAAVHGG
jgi:uncharacterized protein (TIGR00661 family)